MSLGKGYERFDIIYSNDTHCTNCILPLQNTWNG